MQLNTYNAEQLTALVSSNAFSSLNHLPISTLRARSQAANPRAQPDDVLLLTLTDGAQLCGYLGVLPDDLFINNVPHHMGWLSCLWVNNAMRGHGVAKRLISEALQHWQGRLLATEFTDEARTLYEQHCGFGLLTELHGMRYYLKSDWATLLPKRVPRLRFAGPMLRFIDRVVNLIFSATATTIVRSNGAWTTELTKSDAHLLQHTTLNGCQREWQEWNWVLKYPWVEQGAETEESRRYYFTSRSAQFAQYVLRVSLADGTPSSLLICSVRDHHLKIPFIRLQTADQSALRKSLLQLMHNYDVKTVTVFDAQSVQLLNDLPRLLKRPFTRTILCADKHVMKNKSTGLVFCDGDGDCAFT